MRHQQDTHQKTESDLPKTKVCAIVARGASNARFWLAEGMVVLLGMAGIHFALPHRQDEQWWGWPLLQFAAFCLALGYGAAQYRRRGKLLLREIEQRRRAEEMTEDYVAKFKRSNNKQQEAKAISDIGKAVTDISNHRLAKTVTRLESEICERKRIERKLNKFAMEMKAKNLELQEAKSEIEKATGGLLRNAIEKSDLQVKLRESESRARALLNAASESSLLIDRSGIVLACNAAAANLYGLTCQQLIGRHAFDSLSKGLSESNLARVNSVFASGQPVRFEDTRGLRTSDTSIYPVRDVTGEVTACAIFACDISERKQAEKALIAAKDASDAANRAKSEFLAKMSHELRTPMNSIIGFTELMIADKKDIPGERRGRRLEKVHRNANSLLALINDILDLSKVEADQLTLDSEEVDVCSLINECVEMMRPLIKGDRVSVCTQIDTSVRSGDLWVGDAIRLRQVLTNLLGNACKFTDKGKIEVCARVDNGELVIDVKDTGIGIAAEDLPFISEEFHQVDSSNTRRANGTGLGLSIAKKLCLLMGGDITVVSELDKGSCFTARLPMPKTAHACEAIGSLNTKPAGEKTALYIGSERTTQQAATILASGGFKHHHIMRTESAYDAKQAMKLWRRHRPAMLWIDPFWEDALSLLVNIKTHNRRASKSVGFLGMNDDRWASVVFDEYLVPPLGKDTLRRVISTACDSAQPHILLLCENTADSDYVCDFLAEFSEWKTVKATSVRNALDIVAAQHIDATIVGLTHLQATGFEWVRKLHPLYRDKEIKRIAIIPRAPTSEDNAALRAAFRSHIAGCGESMVCIAERLAPAPTGSSSEHPLARVSTCVGHEHL